MGEFGPYLTRTGEGRGGGWKAHEGETTLTLCQKLGRTTIATNVVISIRLLFISNLA